MRVLYQEHAAALWRYAVRLTGDKARAEDVVQETLLRAWRHPEVTDESERSARAWLFTVARNLIIDERRSARYRSESATPDMEQAADHAGARRGGDGAGPDVARRGPGSVVRGSQGGHPPRVLPGRNDRPDRRRPADRGGHREVAAALRDAGLEAQAAGNGGDTVTQFEVPRGGEQLDDDRYATWDAPYVLGSLSDDERREYEAHLQTCRALPCRRRRAERNPGLAGQTRRRRRRGARRRAGAAAATADAGFAARRCARAAQAFPLGDHRRARRGGRPAGDRVGVRGSPGDPGLRRPARTRRPAPRWR